MLIFYYRIIYTISRRKYLNVRIFWNGVQAMAQTESGLGGFIYYKTLNNINAVTSKPYDTYSSSAFGMTAAC
jgi:hypothetical protein